MSIRNASLLHPQTRQQKRSAATIQRLESERRSWLGTLDPGSLFHKLFDHIPGVFFFAKNHEGRTMFASKGILDLYKMNTESEMIGLTDFDLNPKVMAENYVRDDQRLLRKETSHIERLELWFDRLGMPDWFVVTKLPLFDSKGKPQGVMGILRRASENEKQLPVFQTVARAVEIIRRDYGTPILIADVATACGQSLRQLQRHFQSAFGTTPQDFLLRTRILAAANLLEQTHMTIAEIGHLCGFVDASSFTQHFRLRTGQTPSVYREARVLAGVA